MKREAICISQLSYHCVRKTHEPYIRKWVKWRIWALFFCCCFQESVGFSRKGLKIFLCSMYTEYMMHTISICKMLSSLTFSLQSCIWLKSLKADQKPVGNGTPQTLNFSLFSEESPLFIPNSCFWWCIFCPNTYYHSIWTPVKSCCSRMWSGSEAQKLINTSFCLTLCATPHKSYFGKSVKEGCWCMIRLQNAQHREGRNRQVETGHPNAVGAAV